MFEHTRPAAIGADGSAGHWTEFLVTDPREAQALLRRLRDGAVPVNLSAPDGGALTTTLWSVDTNQRRLSFAADSALPQLQRIVEADEAVVVAYLDSIKLQFDLHELLLVHAARASALQAAWPEQIFRFQRRGSFRVRTPERLAPTVHLRHPSLPEMTLALRIVDISVGGCALALPPDVPPLQPGSRLAGVRVELDPGMRFTAVLKLHHVTALHGSDAPAKLGCSWVDIDPAIERTLQRYIDQAQKRQRLLSPGLL